MALELRRRRIGSGDRAAEIIDVIGRLNTAGSAMLRSSLQEVLKEGSPRIAINLSELVEIKKEVFGAIHSLGRACSRAGGSLVVYGATGDPLEYVKAYIDENLVRYFETENEAVVALGGEPEPLPDETEDEGPGVVVVIGADDTFRKIFWNLGVMGGHPVAKFDNIPAAVDYAGRQKIYCILIDPSLTGHDLIRLIRQIRSNPEMRGIGIFIVGKPTSRRSAKMLLDEGADKFVPFVFKGEEIMANFDSRTFFSSLKEAFKRYDIRKKARSE